MDWSFIDGNILNEQISSLFPKHLTITKVLHKYALFLIFSLYHLLSSGFIIIFFFWKETSLDKVISPF